MAKIIGKSILRKAIFFVFNKMPKYHFILYTSQPDYCGGKSTFLSGLRHAGDYEDT
jgi:hypothetical protein